METVLAATLIVFLLMFGAFTLSEAYITTQDTMQTAWQDMANRMSDQMQTQLSAVTAQTDSTGRVIELTLRNEGAQRLIDYENWDVFLQYYDNATPEFYGVKRLPYTHTPVSNQLPILWLNTGLQVASMSKATVTASMLAITDGDHPTSEQIYRLESTPVYGVLALNEVTLAVGDTFTQDDINNGRITYAQQLGSTTDSFTFTIADPAILGLAANQWSVTAIYTAGDAQHSELFEPGVWNPGEELVLRMEINPPFAAGTALNATVGTGNGSTAASTFISEEPHTFAIIITPRVDINAGATVENGGLAVLSSAQLQASGNDTQPADLVYTITGGPSHGTLNLGSSFTQANIDAGEVTYTHDASGLPDEFTFTVTDGVRTTGTYTFTITLSG